jgi:hypothetical protein
LYCISFRFIPCPSIPFYSVSFHFISCWFIPFHSIWFRFILVHSVIISFHDWM